MMAPKTITYTISAVDKATATIERVNRSIERMSAPYKTLAKSARALSDATGLTRVSKDLSNVATHAGRAAHSVTRIAAPLLAIVGGGTIAGLTQMVTQWERFGAETDRTARLLGITANQLTQMRGAAALAGVSAQGMTAGFQALQDTLQDARWGRNQAAFATLHALGITLRRTRTGAVDTQAAMYDLADRIQRIQKRDPAAARNLARSLGVEQLLPMLAQRRRGMQLYEAEARRLRGDFTPQMAARAQAFSLSVSQMGQAVEGLKASIADRLAPVLGPMIASMASWVARNRELISQRVAALVERIANAFERLFAGVNWDSFPDDVAQTVESIGSLVAWLLKAVQHLGGFKTVAMAVGLYMAGGFVTSIASAVASIAGLVLRLGGLASAMMGAGGAAATAAGTAAAAGAAGTAAAGAAAAGVAGAGAVAAGRGLFARFAGGLLRFVNPLTVGAYLGLHSEGLNKGETKKLARIRAAEAATGGVWPGSPNFPANGTPPDNAIGGAPAGVARWAQNLDFAGLEKRYGLPPGLLAAVAHVESRGNPNAASPAGAKGLFQFMPATAREYGINPLDPAESANAAAKKLSGLLNRYRGNLPAALAAYNWGEGNLDRKGMGNAPVETRAYGPKVLAAMGLDAMNSGQALPPLNVPPPRMAATAPPVVNVNTQVHVERDGRTSVRTETPNGLHVAHPMVAEFG